MLSIVTRCITVVRAQRILVICAADPISSQRALPGRRTVPNRDGVYIRESKEFINFGHWLVFYVTSIISIVKYLFYFYLFKCSTTVVVSIACQSDERGPTNGFDEHVTM